MTILAHDTFTGTASDISGRTPDTVGGGATWTGPMSPTTGIIAVGSPTGAHSNVTYNDSYYRLTGLTLPSVYTQTLTPAALTDGWQSILCNMVPGGDGYEILQADSGDVFLYKVTGYSFDLLDNVTAGAGPGVLSVERNESTGTIKVRVDGALVISVTDSDYLAGAPGMSIANGGSTATSVVADYVITDESGGGSPTPPDGDDTQNIALDHFTGSEDVNIDGRTPDGILNPPSATECADLINGVWHKSAHGGDYPGGMNIDVIAADEVVMAGVGRYTDSNGTSSATVTRPADAVTGDGMLLVVASKGTSRHPQPPATGWTLLDRITSSGEEMIVCYRAVGASEPSSYTVTFTGSGSTQVASQILMVRGGGTLGAVATQSTWLSAVNMGPISGLTPGAAPSVIVAIGAKPAALNDNAVLSASGWRQAGWASATAFFTGYSSVGWMWRYQASGTAISAVTIIDSGFGSPGAGAGVGLMVELILASAPADPGTGLAAVRYPGTSFGNYAVYVLKDLPEILSIAQKYMVESEIIVQQTEWANLVFDVLVGADPDYDLGYIVMYGWGPSAGDFNHPPGTDAIVAVNRINYGASSAPAQGGGTYSRLRTAISENTAIPGERVKLRVCFDTETIPGSAILTVYVNDVFLCTATDSGLQQPGVGGVPGDADARWPGMSGQDSSSGGMGQGFKVDYFRVALTCDAPYPTCVPCEGDPDGPNPYPNPPPETVPLFGIWGEKLGDWRQASLTQPDPVQGFKLGPNRRMIAGVVMSQGAWREILSTEGTGDPPTPGDPYPPYYDPCEIAPDLPVPDTPIGAPPDRLFFAWGISTSQLGPLWTATFMAMGSSITTGISQAAARASAVFGTPGDKTKFFTGGDYDPDKMDAWIASLSGLSATVLAAQAAGSFAGVHAADDWENPLIWPPIGLPLTEINRIAGVWKTYFPGLRVMLRARTGQIGGTSLPNIDGIISQMRMTGAEWEAAGRTAAGYAEGELDFCQARGWILHLSQNFYNGTSVRVPMTAAQVLDNGLQWVDVVSTHPHGGAVYGMGGWKFEPSSGYNVTGPDYVNAYAAWRNAMIPLGAPTFP